MTLGVLLSLAYRAMMSIFDWTMVKCAAVAAAAAAAFLANVLPNHALSVFSSLRG